MFVLLDLICFSRFPFTTKTTVEQVYHLLKILNIGLFIMICKPEATRYMYQVSYGLVCTGRSHCLQNELCRLYAIEGSSFISQKSGEIPMFVTLMAKISEMSVSAMHYDVTVT